jgi:hypothetical protein
MAATVSARRQALADLARSRRAEGSSGRAVKIVAVSVVVLGLAGLAWLFLRGRTPTEVLAVRASVDSQIAQLQQAARSGQPFNPDDASFGAVFETVRSVPNAYRDQARAEIGRLFEARETAEVDSYFALPPERRAAELDRRIKAEEERRKKWEAERERRNAERGQGDGQQQRGPGQQAQADGQQPTAAAAAPTGGRRRDGTEEGRNARSKQRIDKTSAENRARQTEYRRAKDQRRIQLGFEPRR